MDEAKKDVQKQEAATPEKGEHTRSRRVYTPAVDIIERKDDIIVIADLPGADEKSVDITLEKNELSIYGKVEPEVPEHHALHLAEYGIGDYKRVFSLTEEVDRDKIQATVRNGVLRIVLPKAEAVKTRKIAVRSEG
ncbi:MAG TPA: Hsp20/alpha crystallin family protein [Thermodesulfovibrionales bacterium]|nr:Hsp20/alpha crystallin family protein [Thermodesulfovibrionales bacterium]